MSVGSYLLKYEQFASYIKRDRNRNRISSIFVASLPSLRFIQDIFKFAYNK